MLCIDLELFVQIPDESAKRILHPAIVKRVEDKLFAIELEEKTVQLEAEKNVLIFYNRNREFVQQSATIKEISQTGENPTVTIALSGKPVSAESRQYYRVSTVASGLTATLGLENACQLNDISVTGFSVIAAKRYGIGTHVEAVLQYKDDQFSGTACIQSVRELGPDRIRYGLHCINDEKSGFELQRGLRHISTAIQRLHMRRLAGNE